MSYRTISHDEALTALGEGTATVIDVRTPGEYEQLGHIPGAWLVPVDLIASAPAMLRDPHAPVLVYCEHGVRSRAASELLSAAGFDDVRNIAGGLSHWTGPREFGAGVLRGPASWLLENADLLPRGGRVLDLACGRGRHALLMASAGFTVTAIDRDPDALTFLRQTANRLRLTMTIEAIDLEADPPPLLPGGPFDAILGFRYLHRPLMPAIREALAPGGRMFYETFTRGQAERGHPTNPAFLLDDGELPALMAPFTILRSREGEFDGSCISSVVAERPR